MVNALTNVGFIGSSQDEDDIRALFRAALNENQNYNLISGTGSGPQLAFQIFREMFPKTSSFRTTLVKECNVKSMVPGQSEFLNVVEDDSAELIKILSADQNSVLLKIGGGEQANKELEMAKTANIKVVEFYYG